MLLLLGLSLPAWGQQEFTNWCFGTGLRNNGGVLVKFTPSSQPPDTCFWNNTASVGAFYGFGNATISDETGNLLFYFDGAVIINRRHRRMTNGVLQDAGVVMNQLSAIYTQPTVIVPAGLRQYHVFYWAPGLQQDGTRAYDLTYAVVDMRQQGGDGAVVRKGLVLTRTFCPRVTAVRHANNRDFWVLTRDLDTRGFQAFRLGAAAAPVGPAVVSLAGQTRFPDLAELKAAPDGRRLACGSLTREADGPRAGVCVYDFDPATGRVSNELVVRSAAVPAFPATAAGRPLTESPLLSSSFSPDARLLYTCELPALPLPSGARRGRDIWQYDLGLASPAAIAQSRRLVSDVPLPPSSFDFLDCLGLQLAPDGTLWSSVCYRRRLVDPATNQITRLAAAIIRRPNVYGPGCGFEAEGYQYLPGQKYSSNLPNLITNMLYAPAALNHEAGCSEDSVQFWASSAGAPAGLRWDFGEPASGAANQATGPQVAHRYAQGGTYPVRLTLADGRVLTQAVAVAAGAVDFTNANVFTPNNDGQNDAFSPVRAPLPGGRLRVFSRWSQPVFSTTDPALRWDGAGAADGTYFYELDYPDCRGTRRHRRGSLLLVR